MATPKSGSRKSDAKPPNDEFMEKLKTFVRTRGADFLNDPNINSVGIGYKQVDNKPTREIAIQFTVDQKVVLEALDDIGTVPIPPSFVIDGVEVPTDVLQRSYEPAYKKVVVEAVTNPRKVRIDPIIPGVSVANRHVSAGTIGCIVFDLHDGTPYVLSNWHVLHGPDGRIGDDVVQPGPHDDNRVDQNLMGKLVRSHLGAAGDGAIATIETRSFQTTILDLDVPVEEIGEAELGDKVIKSGRTTGVTHGVVTRIHTIVRIDYEGNVGLQNIGGFEIGPDEDHLPHNGEISMGGNSGSAWMFKAANGRTTHIMAGLHFAGEGAGDPNEHAMACYPRSIFEKLEITLSPPAAPPAPAEEAMRRGYNADFSGTRVAVPTLTEAGNKKAFKRNGSSLVPYTHFSLALNTQRRFVFWVAWNIDGDKIKKISRTGIPFILDPDIPAQFQVGDSLYSGNRLDRGHIARRADLCWGSLQEAEQANLNSFFFTNITPQMDDFNQGNKGGLWGRLEDAIFEDVDVDNLKVSVFGGPVFREDDRVFRGVKIPHEFFKVIAFVEQGRLKAKAFLLTQNLDELEALDLDAFRVFQVTLAEVEARCEFRFPDALKSANSSRKFLPTALSPPGSASPFRP